MATVDKNFRIKNGLVVEGSTATVNGKNVVTAGVVDAKGDLIVGSADDAVARLGVGTNGHVLTADSNETLGIKWAAPAAVGVFDTQITFEGTTANDFETTLTVVDPTADRTITLPDATGTVQLRVTDVSDTEIGYLNGVTSAIQTQLDDKSTASKTETLTNKTLTTPTIDGPEITATGGTPRIHGIYLPEPHVITFEGATNNEFETVLTTVDPTADRTVSLPNATTTLVGQDTVDTLTNKTLTSPVINTPTGITKSDVGLANVDNTSDANKPVSTATQTALDAKLALAGGTMTGAIAMGTNKITGLGAPTNANDAATKTYVDGVITGLVDGAPDLLNTLNELAAAINDDANYSTTLTTALGNKQDKVANVSDTEISYLDGVTSAIQTQLNAKFASADASTTNISEGTNLYFTNERAQDAIGDNLGTGLSYNDTTGAISVTANTYEPYGAAAAATSALDDVLDATTAFTAINVNSVAKQIAATTGNIVTAAATTAYSWAKASYRSAEFLVKSKTATHTEVTKIMLTLDSSDNIYLTEYGMSSTSGTSLQAITADISGTDVRIRVTPANANTEVLITGTLLV